MKKRGMMNIFLNSGDEYQCSKAVLVGAPMDFTASFRPGSRFGPDIIREMSWVLETYSPYLDKDLNDLYLYDYGNIEPVFGNTDETMAIIGSVAAELFADDKFPVFLGGEHLISLPVIRAAADKYGNSLVLLHFDAHADLRDDYCGQHLSHATVIRRCCEFIDPGNVYQFGIRSGTAEEFEWGRTNTNFYPFELLRPLMASIERLKNRPVYITFDIDVVDPAFAPGTGTPEPAGLAPAEVLEAVRILKDVNVIGFDLVEVMRSGDAAGITGVLGAKIVREALLAFAK